jgi:hypothetical protein
MPLIAAHEARIRQCLGENRAAAFLEMLMRLGVMAASGGLD